jgi:hypothetical protein
MQFSMVNLLPKWYGSECVPSRKESTVRSLLMSSLVITALTLSPNALFAPAHDGMAYAAKKEHFSRGVTLRACQAEARQKKFGFRIFARSRFIRECIKRKRAAH